MSVSICVRSHELFHSLSSAIDSSSCLSLRARSTELGSVLDRDGTLHGASRFDGVQNDMCFAHLWIRRERREDAELRVSQDLTVDRGV